MEVQYKSGFVYIPGHGIYKRGMIRSVTLDDDQAPPRWHVGLERTDGKTRFVPITDVQAYALIAYFGFVLG